MGLFKRITDIISANMQEMVSEAENPEAVLRQAVDEMDSSIQEARGATARALANEKLLRQRLADEESRAEQCGKSGEKAVAAGEDDEAREWLGRKQEHVKIAAALSDQLSAAGQSARTLRRQLDAMRAKLSEAKRSLATLTARHRAAKVRQASVDPGVGTDAFDKFERIREKVEMAEAEADAMRELAGAAVTNDEPPCEPEDESADVAAELEKLKKKLHQ